MAGSLVYHSPTGVIFCRIEASFGDWLKLRICQQTTAIDGALNQQAQCNGIMNNRFRLTDSCRDVVLISNNLIIEAALAILIVPFATCVFGAGISPEIHTDARVTFRVKAAKAEKVLLLGDWLKRGDNHAMAKGEDGVWTTTAGPFPPGNHIYGFEIDGVQTPDPENASVKLRASRAGSFFHIPGDAVWQPNNVAHGNVEINFHRSKTLGDTRWFSVYTPPNYHNTAKEYPVLYLLHGANDTPVGWVMIGSANYIMDNLIARDYAQEMIIVMPFGHAVPHGSPRDVQRTNNEKFEQYLLQDVLPMIENKYRVLKTQKDRAIAGLSMGGGQAIRIGLKNLDKFSVIGSFSGAVPQNERAKQLIDILDDANQVNKALDLFWIGCGRDDFLLERNKDFVKTLKEKGIDHRFQLTDGVHNYHVWRTYFAMLAPALFRPETHPAGTSGNADNVPYLGGRDPQGNPVRLAKRTGHVSNYDEAKVAPYSLPDPLKMTDGRSVTTAEEWNARRKEILSFYEEQIYGRVPKNAPKIHWKVVETRENARADAAVTKTIEGTAAPDVKLRVTLHLPQNKAQRPVPVLLNLSFFSGPIPARFRSGNDERRRFDPIAEVLAHGWAFAQIGYSDIQPDRPNQFDRGVIGLTLPAGQTAPAADQWGTISAWAWGASRVVDYLESDDAIDKHRIALTGASRLGKTALWAAAQDERINSVFSVVPGAMGAALIRRDWGETLDDMAQNFHWQFAGNLQNWAGRWNELPVDQHMLFSLIAPRPVYVNGGISDQWSDPKGEFLSIVAAGPVYKLLGVKDMGVKEIPKLDHPIVSGRLGFHYHSQGHRSVPEDWKQFLKFADRHASEISPQD